MKTWRLARDIRNASRSSTSCSLSGLSRWSGINETLDGTSNSILSLAIELNKGEASYHHPLMVHARSKITQIVHVEPP
jgi:hypothetical protein